jgi:deoxyribonuclease V
MNLDTFKLKREQLKLANNIVLRDSVKNIKTIAGCDCAFTGNKTVACVVVMDSKAEKIIEQKYHIFETSIPYKKGYLFYREGPPIIEAYNQLENKPDAMMCDFNGILHPRRIGAASQIGLVLDIPTIGIAKNLMMGTLENGKIMVENEIRAIKVTTREHAKPIYVSPGHNISFGSAVDLVKRCIKYPHKLPEPVHTAHRLSKKEASKLQDET